MEEALVHGKLSGVAVVLVCLEEALLHGKLPCFSGVGVLWKKP